jgi:hypothetical protein
VLGLMFSLSDVAVLVIITVVVVFLASRRRGIK